MISFVLFMDSFAVQELDEIPFVYFCFISIALGDWPKKTFGMIYVRKYFAYVHFYEFYGIMSYAYVFKSFWVYVCVW